MRAYFYFLRAGTDLAKESGHWTQVRHLAFTSTLGDTVGISRESQCSGL
jgi:hypothetical protein